MLMELELTQLLAPNLPSNTQLNLTWSSITLGHKMSLPVRGTSDQRSTWPKGAVVSCLAKRCLCLGHIWPKVNLIKRWSSITLGHKMSLWGGSGWHFVKIASQPASKPASCNWPANQPCAQMSTCQTSGWSHSWWRENWGPTTLGPSPGFKQSHWFPLGEWPTWLRPGKWHKRTLQPFIYHCYYLQGPFAVLYLCYLITYSCIKCGEILSRLFSFQTNLCTSFHHHSGVLLHQGTTF